MSIFSFYHNRVFHDPLVSLNFEGFDPQTFLNDPQNLLFTFFNPLPDDKFYTLPNWKSLQTTISNLTKMEESYPNE